MFLSRPTFPGLIPALLMLSLLAGCSSGDALDRIQSQGELRVISRNAPTTFYTDGSGPAGFEFALASLLAEDLGVELRMEPAFTLQGIFERLQRGETDLAAAGLGLTAEREATYPHSVAYYQQVPRVVYRAGKPKPRKAADLVGKRVVVLAQSSHAESLRALQQDSLPELDWREIEGTDSMELLDLIDADEADVAIIDSNELSVQQVLYPQIRVAFEWGEEQDFVWFFPPGVDNTRLLERVDTLLGQLETDGLLAELRDQHFGEGRSVARTGAYTFSRNMRNTLPKYQDLIQQVAAEYQLDWQLLAAIAYQESHWDPLATSPTGVRGMMMLTQPTAAEVGVTDRLDPAQSLRGGARYLKNVKRRLPKGIKSPERTWFALAAYNIGLGHLEDARILTERLGGNPNVWADVKRHLPLLQKSKHYEKARYGYARGGEAALYVENIRHYTGVLEWQHITDNKPLPPLVIDDYLPQAASNLELPAL